MNILRNHFCACILVSFILISPVFNAPRYKSKGHSSTKYDQKQSGDYNIQLHLKDFHIVAVLGDDTWGGYGDYDYNYDYSDMTVKPIIPITTASPSSASITPENIEILKPDNSIPEKPVENQNVTITVKPENLNLTTLAPGNVTLTTAKSEILTLSIKKVENQTVLTTVIENQSVTTDKSPKPLKSTKVESSIEVFDKKGEASVNISVIDAETPEMADSEHNLPLGEIMHYRKCAEGYTRNKQGRCRKVTRRTPQIPFGITRLASNLATRFRQATSGDTSLSEER